MAAASEPAKACTLSILTAFALARPSWQGLGASVGLVFLFPALGSTQTTMALPSLVAYYQFIKADDSDHIYFHKVSSPVKHLVRGGRCHMCDHPHVCKYVVVFERSYLDALPTATDFTCDMLDDIPGTTTAVPLTPQKPPDDVDLQGSLLALLARFPLVVLGLAVLCLASLLALGMLQCVRAQQGNRKRTTRSLTSDDSEASDSCDSASTPHDSRERRRFDQGVEGSPYQPLPKRGPQQTPELHTPLRPGREFDLVTVTPNGYEVRPLPAEFMAAAVPGVPPTPGASPPAQPSQMASPMRSMSPVPSTQMSPVPSTQMSPVPSTQKALAPSVAAAFSVPTTVVSAVPTQAPQGYDPATNYQQGLAVEAH